MRFLYLHGFASGPRSRKAQAFRSALAACGVKLEILNLVPCDFEHITLSGQLQIVEEALDGEPCRLIGSSMGGHLASVYAATHPEVDRLVLLAPAFGFVERWLEMQGPDAIRRWKETGWLNVFHYADQMSRPVHYALLEDAANFPPMPDFRQPALIFHGIHDAVVPIDFSRRFAATHPQVLLRELDSDHELLDVLEEITADSVAYLMA